MERLRSAACTAGAAGAVPRPTVAADAAVLAEADDGVIRSASCAMKVPRPIRIAAKIIMLRMTPQTRFVDRRFHHTGPLRATNAIGASGHFGEKDERSVNASQHQGGSFRFRAAWRAVSAAHSRDRPARDAWDTVRGDRCGPRHSCRAKNPAGRASPAPDD